jgi:cytochrome P450
VTEPVPATGPVPPPGCPAHAAAQLYGEEFARDPAAVYRRLRSYGSFAPVELAPGVDATLVISYDAALQVLRGTDTFGKDARRWKAWQEGRIPEDSPVAPLMADRPNAFCTEGDEHRRLRWAIDDCMARIDPNVLRSYIESCADEIIDGFAERGTADLVAEYAKELPLRVLIKVFGCPADLGDRLYTGICGLFDGIDAEKAYAVVTESIVELIELRRRRPADDMVTWLTEHESRLTDAELIDQLVVLTAAATDPQQNLIANALRLLLSDDRFAGTLNGGSLPVEDALDEVLWTDPPIANYGVHYAFHDVEIDGTRLEAGTPIVISFAAATTEPAIVTDQRAGNRAHLAWSAGPHACPAQREARIIATVALERLLDRLPDLELTVPVEELTWRPGPFHRGLDALPVRFPPAGRTGAAWEASGAGADAGLGAGAGVARATSAGPSGAAAAVGLPSAPRRRPWSFAAGWRRGR